MLRVRQLHQVRDGGVEPQRVVVVGHFLHRLRRLARKRGCVRAAALDRHGCRFDDQAPDALQETRDAVETRVGPFDVLLGRTDEHLVDAAGVCTLLSDQLIR